MPYDAQAFGIVIGRLRTRLGLSQEAAAGLAGISRSHLALLEAGRKTVRLDTFWRLADALRVTPAELMRLVELEVR